MVFPQVPDYLSDALGALKLLAAIVSGFGAIIAARADPVRRPQGRRPRRRAAIAVAVAGLIVAVLAQALESIQDAKNTRQVVRQTAEANQMLASIQQVLTRFDTFNYESEFALPASDPRVQALIGELHALADGAHSVPNVPGLSVYNVGTANATVALLPFDWTQPVLRKLLPSLAGLDALWQMMPLRPGIVWINRTPKSIEFLTSNLAEGTDLFYFNCNLPLPPPTGGLFYYDRGRRLVIRTVEFQTTSAVPDCWGGDMPVASIQSLGGAQFVTEIDWSNTRTTRSVKALLETIRPDFVHISVGHSAIFLYKPRVVVRRPGAPPGNPNPGYYVEATLPSANDILNQKAARPPPWMVGQ